MKKRSADSRLEEIVNATQEELEKLEAEQDRAERAFRQAVAACSAKRAELETLLVVLQRVDERWPPPGEAPPLVFGDTVIAGLPRAFRPGSDAEVALRELHAAGKPLHVDELIRRVEARTGRSLLKASIVSTLSRLAKAGMAVQQVGPNTFEFGSQIVPKVVRKRRRLPRGTAK